MTKISVIVPVYMVEKYLKRCVDSLLSQTVSDFELILIDDGSKDSSGIICDEYSAKDVRVKVIHQTNKGVSEARNTGLAAASGQYVTFVDADDYVEQDYLEWMLADDADMICQTATLTDEKDQVIERHQIDEKWCVMGDSSNLMKLLNEGVFNWTHCKRLTRKIIEENHIRFQPDIDFAEDTLFMVRYAKCVKNIKIQNIAKYHYVIYSSRKTLSNQYTKKRIKVIEKANHLIAKECAENAELQEQVFCDRMRDFYSFFIYEYIRTLQAKDFRHIIPAWWCVSDGLKFLDDTQKASLLQTHSIMVEAAMSKSNIKVVGGYVWWRMLDIKKRHFSRTEKK